MPVGHCESDEGLRSKYNEMEKGGGGAGGLVGGTFLVPVSCGEKYTLLLLFVTQQKLLNYVHPFSDTNTLNLFYITLHFKLFYEAWTLIRPVLTYPSETWVLPTYDIKFSLYLTRTFDICIWQH
jgi:hypothetical protein